MLINFKCKTMIHEDINLRWYNFDDSEEIILDDRLDDLSVNTQGVAYTEGTPRDDEVEAQVDAARRATTIVERDAKEELKSFVASVDKGHSHGRRLRELLFASLFHSYRPLALPLIPSLNHSLIINRWRRSCSRWRSWNRTRKSNTCLRSRATWDRI